MAAKAYVSSMTVAELTSELKKRGLNCRGKKKTLQNRLEQALYEEENSESSSEGSNEATIKAASAVIHQLEGNVDELSELTTPASPPLTDKTPLIVSIEHSKRQQQVETNGDLIQDTGQQLHSDLIQDTGQQRHGDGVIKESPKNEQLMKNELIKEPIDTPISNDNSTIQQNEDNIQPVVMETVAKQPVIAPEASDPIVPNETAIAPPTSSDVIMTSPAQQQAPPTSSDVIVTSPAQQQAPPTSSDVIVTSPAQQQAPPTSSDVIMTSPVQPEGGTESEVNSIAVEPPSPCRDDITFSAVDYSLSEDMIEESNPMTSDTQTQYEERGNEKETQRKEEETHIEKEEERREDDIVEDKQQSSDIDNNNNNVDNNNDDNKQVKESEEERGEKEGVSCGGDIATNEAVDIVVSIEEEDEEELSIFSAEEANSLFNTTTQQDTPTTGVHIEKGKEVGLMGGANNNEKQDSKKRQGSVDDDKRDNESNHNKRRRISTSPKRLQERKRRWGSSTSSRTPSMSQPPISSDTLENIIPEDVKEEMMEIDMNKVIVPSEEEETEGDTMVTMVTTEQGEDDTVPVVASYQLGTEEDDKADKQYDEDIVDLGKDSSMLMDEYEKEWQDKEKEKEQQRREIGRARKEVETRKSLDERQEPVKRTGRQPIQAPPPQRRSPSPPCNPPSRILHIKHLKRPFTISQLKELVQEDGPMIDGGFWTNKIKSHCIAIFLSTDTAIATRNRLHGMKWPSTNPELLKVDFLSNKQVSEVSEGCLIIDSRSPSPAKDVGVAVVGGAITSEKLAQKKDSIEKTDTAPLVIEKKEVQAPPTKEEKATRMLDDLFNKTKATPPIYWMPLSNEEMERKASERQVREREREKRREERRKEHEEQLEKERRERKPSNSYRNRSPPRRRSPRGRSPRGRSPRRSRSPRRR